MENFQRAQFLWIADLCYFIIMGLLDFADTYDHVIMCMYKYAYVFMGLIFSLVKIGLQKVLHYMVYWNTVLYLYMHYDVAYSASIP